MKKILTVMCIAAIAVTSCKKDKKTDTPPADPGTPTEAKGSMRVFFENKVDSFPLIFGMNYKNANGDSFNISKFNYYISNVVLVKEDGTEVKETESYHLVRHSIPATNEFTVSGIPLGTYKALRLTIGVDSARNVSGVQSGDLSPSKAADMFWGWSTGYIFFMMEGQAPNAGSSTKHYEFHVGGYGGTYKGQRTIDLSFNSDRATVTSAVAPKIHLLVNANTVFNGQTKIDVAKPNYYAITMPNAYSAEIADNYKSMIRYDHLHND